MCVAGCVDVRVLSVNDRMDLESSCIRWLAGVTADRLALMVEEDEVRGLDQAEMHSQPI